MSWTNKTFRPWKLGSPVPRSSRPMTRQATSVKFSPGRPPVRGKMRLTPGSHFAPEKSG